MAGLIDLTSDSPGGHGSIFVDDDEIQVVSSTSNGHGGSSSSASSSSGVGVGAKRQREQSKPVNPELAALRKQEDELAKLAAKANDAATPSEIAARQTQVKQKLLDLLSCVICFEQPMVDIHSTTCGHVFCKGCITACIHTSKRCPVCNTSLKAKDAHPLYL